MIDVDEHFYDDDPAVGHPDVRTRLKDACYFFLGNGHIQAAVQFSPSGEGTPVGLLIMNPDHLRKKRECLTCDIHSGLEKTMIQVTHGRKVSSAKGADPRASWSHDYESPAVRVEWITSEFKIVEVYRCPDIGQARLIREVSVENVSNNAIEGWLETGFIKTALGKDFSLKPGNVQRFFIQYSLDHFDNEVSMSFVKEELPSEKTVEYWRDIAYVSFGSHILDNFFNASRNQLSAGISNSGRVDGSIWQYNREWVRDQSMVAIGLILSGHHQVARTVLNRLLTEFVNNAGDTIDSSESRKTDEVELDQNGSLLFGLAEYAWWTGDDELIGENWEKIRALATYPLQSVFRHPSSGLLANRRDYWERHRAHGIEKGMELAVQLWMSAGLSAAAGLARLTSHYKEADLWEKEAQRIRKGMFDDENHSLIEKQVLIKRRGEDGSVQDEIQPLLDARLPQEAPLSQEGLHPLNPDTSAALPIALGFVLPDSTVALNTMESLELLWNQAWENGGYGRYHFRSEPDSPGGWAFPSLFMARAYLEMGEYEKVWRVLEWLNSVPGSRSGSWFEFYGKRIAPPYPQVGIPPWTWAEMIILLVYHVLGIRPSEFGLWIRPKILPGIHTIRGSFPFRGKKLKIEIQKKPGLGSICFDTKENILEKSKEKILISFPKKDIEIHVDVP
jgi:hypothetical protein